MRLPTVLALALAPLISLATADSMVIKSGCGLSGCGETAVWRSPNSAERSFYPLPGCHPRDSIPDMTTLCLDMDLGRGHFYFDNGPRRCITKGETRAVTACKSAQECGYETTWEEGRCTW